MHERPALLQLQHVLLHALYSAVQLQLTTSSSAWGATGAVETAGVMADPSMFQPKLAIFRASSGGSRWPAAFHSPQRELCHFNYTCIASTVAGERTGRYTNPRGKRVLRVSSLIRAYGKPALCGHVWQHLVVDGGLNVSHVLTRDSLKDLAYVLTSCDVSQVSRLK